MIDEPKIQVMTRLPISIRTFFEEEGKKQNKSLSAIVSDVLTAHYVVMISLRRKDLYDHYDTGSNTKGD